MMGLYLCACVCERECGCVWAGYLLACLPHQRERIHHMRVSVCVWCVCVWCLCVVVSVCVYFMCVFHLSRFQLLLFTFRIKQLLPTGETVLSLAAKAGRLNDVASLLSRGAMRGPLKKKLLRHALNNMMWPQIPQSQNIEFDTINKNHIIFKHY